MQTKTVPDIILVQISLEVLDFLDQVHPLSTNQVEFNPSPFIKFASSQKVEFVLIRIPSPQISFHPSFFSFDPPSQLHSFSTLHWLLHPSPLIVFPSSQRMLFELNLIPSPHISSHRSWELDVPPVQLHPASIVHSELQPSPFNKLPSSQVSEDARSLSPQTTENTAIL